MKLFQILILSAVLILTISSDYGLCQRSLSKLHDLVFDDVFAGTNSEVLVTDPNSAQFYIYTMPQSPLTISFVLPTVLKSTGNPDIPVTFDMAHASYRKTTNNPNGSTYFNPNNQLTINNVSNKNVFYVWLGGVAHPPNGTPPASYTATITITTSQN
jgi:hypothetical protein